MTAFSAIAESAEAWPEDEPLPTLPPKLPEGAQSRPAHKDAARQIAWALAQNTGGDWLACGAALRLLLNAQEAFGLAMAALGAVEERDMTTLLDEALPEYAGQPMAPWIDVRDDATWWASMATERELRAYAMACLLRIPEAERAQMVAALKGRSAS